MPDAGQALALWSVQIAFNALWTPVFFGLKRMGAGLVVVLLLWVAVALTMVALRQRESLATLRTRNGVLVLETLLWPDEIRVPDFPKVDPSQFHAWRRRGDDSGP